MPKWHRVHIECEGQCEQGKLENVIGRYIRGGGVVVQIRLLFFLLLLYSTPANISRKLATGSMASQHLRTFEIMGIFKSADLNVVFI